MLDPVIKAHVKKQDAIEEKVRDSIDAKIQAINLEEFINDPDNAFMVLAEDIGQMIIEEHAEEAINNGIKVAETFESLKRDIVIPLGEPDMNKDIEVLKRGN